MTERRFHNPEIERMAAGVSQHRKKGRARSAALAFLKRHKIVRRPCACGARGDHMHHPDYDKPLEVAFLCARCHGTEHMARMGLHSGFDVHNLAALIPTPPRRDLCIADALEAFGRKGVRQVRSEYAAAPGPATIKRLADEHRVSSQTIRNVLKGFKRRAAS